MLPPLVSPSATEAAVIAGVVARMGAAVGVGGIPLATDVPWRIRVALAIALAAVAAPTAILTAQPAFRDTAQPAFRDTAQPAFRDTAQPAVRDTAQPAAPTITAVAALLVGEALVGVALGAAVAAVVAAAGWAGRWLASVAGLSWADDFSLESSAGPPGVARLAWWLGCLGFLAADGHLAVIGGFVDSVVRLPVGAALAADRPAFAALVDMAVGMPAVALELALTIGGAALGAVLVFHVAAALCLRTIRFTPGQGMLQALAATVMLVVLFVGADAWLGGFGRLARERIDEGLAAVGPLVP